MPVIQHSEIETFALPGLQHQTLAGRPQGVTTMETWMQTIEPQAGTPVHRHDCEEVIVVLKGSGIVTIDGQTTDFGPHSTLIVPPNAVHQLINTGEEPMFLVATLGMSPVRVETETGEVIPLPWQA
ncbi:MAG TPA: cupin domain-containing protein [Acidobacteriota bacterium]|nr:cupin domain-containing protein [Acidobacteriota bacterium]